jgi:hypothetical protein
MPSIRSEFPVVGQFDFLAFGMSAAAIWPINRAASLRLRVTVIDSSLMRSGSDSLITTASSRKLRRARTRQFDIGPYPISSIVSSGAYELRPFTNTIPDVLLSPGVALGSNRLK